MDTHAWPFTLFYGIFNLLVFLLELGSPYQRLRFAFRIKTDLAIWFKTLSSRLSTISRMLARECNMKHKLKHNSDKLERINTDY
uniref:Uncharacterized protein n=1 Tax=Arundo donax TaxID=35708 RepID=A0A0A9D8X1_ARUDO